LSEFELTAPPLYVKLESDDIILPNKDDFAKSMVTKSSAIQLESPLATARGTDP
jgi:hypothetical protein